MTDVRSYPKQFLAEFIELYRSFPCIWKVKSKEYSDRRMKTMAYQKMVQKLLEVEPDADRELVIRKINSLRSSYRKEKKKIQLSAAAADTDEIHIPKLWYYELFQFLDDQESFQAPAVKYEDVYSRDGTDTDNDLNDSSDYFPSKTSTKSVSESQKSDIKLRSSTVAAVTSNPLKKPPDPVAHPSTVVVKREVTSDDEETPAGKRLCEQKTDARSEDEHDAYGRNVAFKLRNLPNSQRIYLEKIINNAIFEAELGQLSRSCYIHIPTLKKGSSDD